MAMSRGVGRTFQMGLWDDPLLRATIGGAQPIHGCGPELKSERKGWNNDIVNLCIKQSPFDSSAQHLASVKSRKHQHNSALPHWYSS